VYGFGRVDAWATFDTYAPHVYTKLNIFLEGPYQPGSTMITNLKTGGLIPLTSPYTQAARVVTSIPADVVDWALVEVRSTYNGSAVGQQSFFIKDDGSIVDEDGSTTDLLIPNAPVGDYYIVVRHRNHLDVMTRLTQSLGTGSPALYDFSTVLTQYYGEVAALLETDVYGMYSGDADGSGTVDANDRSATWNERNKTDYNDSDCGLTGTVDANDRSITWNNRNKYTRVEDP
jgi:hypothetical protein